jgi:hypothetical protein
MPKVALAGSQTPQPMFFRFFNVCPPGSERCACFTSLDQCREHGVYRCAHAVRWWQSRRFEQRERNARSGLTFSIHRMEAENDLHDGKDGVVFRNPKLQTSDSCTP